MAYSSVVPKIQSAQYWNPNSLKKKTEKQVSQNHGSSAEETLPNDADYNVRLGDELETMN